MKHLIHKIRHILPILGLCACGIASAADSYKFDFGDGPVASGYTQIKANTKFSAAQGYGFESGKINSVDRLWDDELTTDFLTTSDEMVFSILLPQGNYEVTFILGDGENDSETTIWAENRKLMLDRITTIGSVFTRQTFSLRRMETKSIDGSVTMTIKDREKTYYTWDNKLTFTIKGKAPAVAGIEINKKEDVRTLWLCGNSTVVDQLNEPWAGWGQMIPNFFLPSLAVANYAESGLTASGFYSMKRLAKILTEVKKGDYVTVQFAHNDQKNATEMKNYETTLTKFVNDIKAKGAIPLFITSTARQGELDVKTSVGGLPERMRTLGKKLGVTVLDLNKHTVNLQKALGNDAKYLYMYTASDKTHFCEYGGYELAKCILEEIKTNVPELAKHIRDDYKGFNSNKPDPLNILSQTKEPITEGGLIIVDPEEPTLTYTGQIEQEVLPDEEIEPITFTYGGTATGIEVVNLPEGLKTVVDGTNMTISGATKESGSFTVKTEGDEISYTVTIKQVEGKSKRIAYVTDTTNEDFSKDKIFQMLKKQKNIYIRAIDANNTKANIDVFDMVLINEITPSTAPIIANLEGINKPILNMKVHAYKTANGAWSWATAGFGDNTTATTIYVDEEFRSHPMFDGIELSDGEIKMVSAVDTKALTFMNPESFTDATGDINAIASVKGEDQVCILEIPVGNSVAGTKITEKFIQIGLNSSSFANLTDDALSIICNACYYLMDLKKDTTAETETYSASSDRITVSPNPAHDILNISLETRFNDIVVISLIDMVGKTAYKTSIELHQGENSHTVDLSGIASGIYLLRLEGSNIHATSKIVIKN